MAFPGLRCGPVCRSVGRLYVTDWAIKHRGSMQGEGRGRDVPGPAAWLPRLRPSLSSAAMGLPARCVLACSGLGSHGASAQLPLLQQGHLVAAAQHGLTRTQAVRTAAAVSGRTE